MLIGIDSLSGHYVILENLDTPGVILSGHVDFAMNSLTYDSSHDRVLVAGVSPNISYFFLKDAESIELGYTSESFSEIYSVKLIRNNRFVVISGDSNMLEILENKSFNLVKRIHTKTDIFLFQYIQHKLFFYDDENYTTYCLKI